MISENDIQQVHGADIYSADGEKIGRAGQVYLDDETGRPEWVTVHTGLFGTNESFIPLTEAQLGDDRVTVPFTKDQVKDAPNIDPEDGHISQDEERGLYDHYGMSYSERRSDSGLPDSGVGNAAVGDAGVGDRSFDDTRVGDSGVGEAGAVGRDTSGPATDDAMTRSEERLNVGTQSQETGRARLRKYVTTEQQTVNVPVTREEVRIEREPITEGNVGDAMSGPDISEEEHEVTLHEERPVVEKEAVPVERVRLSKEQVTDQESVTDEVRKEQIETDGVDRGER
jgi:uncharacterized protein (TIGR02271 family)